MIPDIPYPLFDTTPINISFKYDFFMGSVTWLEPHDKVLEILRGVKFKELKAGGSHHLGRK